MSTGETKSNVRSDHSVVVVVVCAEIWFSVFVFKLLICIARLLFWRSSSVIKLSCYSFAAIEAVPPKLPMIASSELWREKCRSGQVGWSVSLSSSRTSHWIGMMKEPREGIWWWDGMGWEGAEQQRWFIAPPIRSDLCVAALDGVE